MTLTDEELDRNWQPNGRRPRSTIARNFQLELEDIFRLDAPITGLDKQKQLNERKQKIGKTSQELAALEARLCEMEERLSRTGHQVLPRPANFKPQHADAASSSSRQLSALADDNGKSRSRPGTARAAHQAPSSGHMPPTPGASEDGDRE